MSYGDSNMFDKFIEELKINGRGNKTIALYKSPVDLERTLSLNHLN